MCTFCTIVCGIFFIIRTIQPYFIINVHRSTCEYPLVIANFNETLTSGKIFKIKIPNFMNIRPVVDKFLHADGHTDMTVLTDTFCNFTNGPKMRGNVNPLKSQSYLLTWTALTSHFIIDTKDCFSYPCT